MHRRFANQCCIRPNARRYYSQNTPSIHPDFETRTSFVHTHNVSRWFSSSARTFRTHTGIRLQQRQASKYPRTLSLPRKTPWFKKSSENWDCIVLLIDNLRLKLLVGTFCIDRNSLCPCTIRDETEFNISCKVYFIKTLSGIEIFTNSHSQRARQSSSMKSKSLSFVFYVFVMVNVSSSTSN